jgi:hypothetical protein
MFGKGGMKFVKGCNHIETFCKWLQLQLATVIDDDRAYHHGQLS